jgi:hypothetical protein
MTYKKYILALLTSAIIAWFAWFLIIYKLNPYETMSIALPFFFLTLFIALSCTFAIIGFYFRLWLFNNEIFFKHINIALRQGIFLSLITIFCLVFQMLRVLSWWSGILLLFIIALMEFFFSSKSSENT